MNYIALSIDKSAFQSLSPREASWLFHHFRINCPPVFFAEILGDLLKRKPKTASPEGDVIALAKKITSHALHTNAGSREIMVNELHARWAPLDGRILDARAEVITLDNGEKAVFMDGTATQDMLARWVAGDFSETERDFAREWREGLSQIKLEEVFRQSKAFRRAEIKSFGDVKELVSTLTTGRDFQLMQTLYDLAGVGPSVLAAALRGWRESGRPPLNVFFPYSHFVLRIELFFLLGLANQVITTRDSNRIDIEYLKYLPFTQVFSSSDDLHIQTAQHFMMLHNEFIGGVELKRSLAQIADFWDAVPEDTRNRGTASFADYPPPELDNGVTKLYDRYIPGWRKNANKPKPKASAEENARTMARLKPIMEEMQRKRRKD
jgi:hypothetical protein